MNVNKLIIDTLSPIGYPVAYIKYTPFSGETPSNKYITFNFADDRGINFADDVPQSGLISVQIHFFAPLNFNHIAIKKDIRVRLFNAGFTYPEIITLTENDNGIIHLVYECEIEVESEVI